VRCARTARTAAAAARSVVDCPECRSTKAAIIRELCLHAKGLIIIVADPLAVEDDLLDAGTVGDEIWLQLLLADDPLDFTL